MGDLEHKLFNAVDEGNKQEVENLLLNGASLNVCLESGKTILGQAVLKGNVDIIRILLECESYYEQAISNRLSVNTTVDEELSSPLEMSFSLLWSPLGPFSSRRKCDMNITDMYERTPLHYAAEQGNVNVLNLLLSSNCRANVSDSENVSPLHIAVSRGHLNCVRTLLKHGCSVNQKTRYNSDKVSALHMAASIGHNEVVVELLKYGAKIDIIDSSERTPLFLAVCSHNYDAVQTLLKSGAKVNFAEIHGYTPLVEAVWEKDVKMVKMLIQAGAHVSNTRSHNILHFSVKNELAVITKFLVDAGSQVNVRDDNGNTPLHIACHNGSTALVEFLTDCGADVSLQNGLSGSLPLHEAVSGILEDNMDAFRAILRILLAFGTAMNAETSTPGETALYNAIVLKKFTFAKILIAAGSDVNRGRVYTCDIDNLFLASKNSHFETVKMLVFAGFNLNRVTWLDSLTPNSFNDQSKATEIKNWIVNRQKNPLMLTNLCRIAIRKVLGENIAVKLQNIHLPKRIESFLVFESF